MSTGENILNAFQVVKETYNNLKKMLDELEVIAINHDFENIINNTPRFIRWKADAYSDSWFLGNSIKLFQQNNNETLNDNTSLRSGPIYAFEVHLGNSIYKDSPEVILSKYEYYEQTLKGIEPKVSDHWLFYEPTRRLNDFNHEEKGEVTIAIPKSDIVINKYRGIKSVSFKRIKLMDINSNNLEEKFKILISL